jgi:cobalt-zinc-cadmium efflux system membrane fusion protein
MNNHQIIKVAIPNYSFLLLWLFLFAGCGKNHPQQEEKDVDPNKATLNQYQMKQISLDTAHTEEERSEVRFGGAISMDQDHAIPVYSFVSGKVLKVPVATGDYVKKGQILAVLMSTDLSNNLAQLDAGKAALALAYKQLDATRELYKAKLNSLIDLATAESAYKAAEDALIALETTRKTFGVDSSEAKNSNNLYKIVAPTDGYIVSKSLNEGTIVLEGTSSNLFMISNIKNSVWVLFNIFENDMYRVHEGDPVDVVAYAFPDKTYPGVISNIGSVLDPASNTIVGRVVLNNEGNLLKAGLFASVRVHVDQHRQAVAIPRECLVYYDNDYYVEKQTGKYTFEKTQVVVDGYTTKFAYISKGVSDKDVLVGYGSSYVLGQ